MSAVASEGPGATGRSRLNTLLTHTPAGTLVSVIADAGFGKSTLLASWQASSPVAAILIPLNSRHDDVDVLALEILGRLERVLPAIGKVVPASLADKPDWSQIFVDVSRHLRSASLVAMFDDLHKVTSVESQALIANLTRRWLNHTVVVVSSRHAIPFDVEAPTINVTNSHLRLTARDIQRGSGGTISLPHAREIADATWGWPAAVQVALRHGAGGERPLTNRRIALAEHLIPYVEEEVLADRSDDELQVLMASAALDAVRFGSLSLLLPEVDVEAALAHLRSSEPPLITVGRGDAGLVMHDVVRQALDDRFRRDDPDGRVRLIARYVDLLTGLGQDREAFQHVLKLENRQTLIDFVARRGFRLAMRGEVSPLRYWLDQLEPAEVLASPPLLFVHALCATAACDFASVANWLGLYVTTTATYSPEEAQRARLRASAVRELAGMESFGEGLQAVSEVLEAPFRTIVSILQAVACGTMGDNPGVRSHLDACADAVKDYPLLEMVYGSAESLYFSTIGDWEMGQRSATHARQVARAHGLEESTLAVGLDVADAYTQAHLGNLDEARPAFDRAVTKLAQLQDGMRLVKLAWLVFLADAAVLLGDYPHADSLVTEAEDLLLDEPHAQAAARMAREVRAKLGRAPRRTPAGLTPMEVDVLAQLATHKSAPTIAGELRVGVTTVRSHIQNIYRKLHVHDRAEAVEEGRRLGLIRV